MIKSVTIKNFQAHRNSYLEFDKGINIINGSSDSGKTAIFRSIYWGLTNRPTGNSFINYANRDKDGLPKKATSVELVFDDGTLLREKVGKDNLYKVKEQEFSTFGVDVPNEVEVLSRLSDINIAKQKEPTFLISSSAGEVAKYLNKTIKLDLIDVLMAEAESDRRRCNKEIKETNDDLLTTDKAIALYDSYLDKLDLLVEKYEKKQENITARKEKQLKLIEYATSIKKLKSSIKENEELVKKIKPIIIEYEKILTKQESVSGKVEKLESLKDDMKLLKERVRNKDVYTLLLQKISMLVESSKLLSDVKKKRNGLVENKELVVEYTESIKNSDTYKLLITLLDNNVKVCNNLKEAQKKHKALSDLYKSAGKLDMGITELNTDLFNLKESMPDVCVLCGAVLNKE